MIQIGNTLVSLDIIETFFFCDLDRCKGQCCIEGDAGAPLTEKESELLGQKWICAKEYMNSRAIDEVERHGVSYIDSEGDLVTTIIDGKDCAFTCHENGICLCSLEKAYRLKKTGNYKPISCFLYPIRITEYPTFTALNYHKWDVCRPALKKGIEVGVRLYEFLKEPLTRKFGEEWYEELSMTAELYLEEKSNKKQT